MVARVYITLKQGVLDPAGKAVETSLHTLGFPDVASVRLGKYVELQLPENCSLSGPGGSGEYEAFHLRRSG